MQNIDFSNVKDVGGNYASPGSKGIFTITGFEYKAPTDNAKAHVAVTFTNDATNEIAKEKFFLTEKALPRFKYLLEKITGSQVTGSFDLEKIKKSILNKKTGLKITGQVGTNGKGYSAFEYQGFLFPPTEADLAAASFSPAEQKKIDAALAAMVNEPSNESDADDISDGASHISGAHNAPDTLEEDEM